MRRLDELTDAWAGGIEFVEETDDELAAAMRSGQTDRVRYARPSRVPPEIRAATAETLQYLADAPVSSHGRLERLWYVQEQSLTRIYHRYGNLGLRGYQVRAPLLSTCRSGERSAARSLPRAGTRRRRSARRKKPEAKGAAALLDGARITRRPVAGVAAALPFPPSARLRPLRPPLRTSR